MKVNYSNFIDYGEEDLVHIAYFKKGKWRIYGSASAYAVADISEFSDLIGEVMEEHHVSRKNVKIVKAKYVMFKEVKI